MVKTLVKRYLNYLAPKPNHIILIKIPFGGYGHGFFSAQILGTNVENRSRTEYAILFIFY
jgi:hypothetical protein